MARTGVFGALSLTIPKDRLASWKATAIVRPAGWPSQLTTNTKYLPDYGGRFPDERMLENGEREIISGEIEHPTTVVEVLARMAADDSVRITHAIRLGGSVEVDAYFADYDTFFSWFDAFALLAWEASRHGGKGEGVFLWDEACSEPVVFALTVGDGVRVDRIDPQNASALNEKWGERFEAIRSAD